MIDEDYNLIVGNTDTIDDEGEIYIWVAICSFVDDTAKNEYALAENMRNTFKTFASEEDFIFSIAQIVREEISVKQKVVLKDTFKKNYPDLPSSFSSRMKLAEDILIKDQLIILQLR